MERPVSQAAIVGYRAVEPRPSSTPNGEASARLDGILVPFQFDLGGSLRFDKELIDRLGKIGHLELSPVKTRSFNVSYLSRNSPILRVSLEDLPLHVAGVDWNVSRSLVLYPWLGTASLSYYFKPAQTVSSTRLLQFYDELITLIDADYLPYLEDHERMNLALQLKLGYDRSTMPPSCLHMGETINELRSTIKQSIMNPRPRIYYFMNFRVLYFWTSESDRDVDHHLLAALLELRRLASRHPADQQADLTSEIGQIWSNGWVTASIIHASDHSEDAEMPPVDVVEAAFGLCHAQWFLCQIWISIYTEVITDEDWQNWSRATVQKYTDHLYALERDLTEVANLDVMLRDPRLIRLSRFFLERLGVSRHLEDAKTRVSLLTQYLRGHLEIQTSRAASRLQVLFAFSAAAAIAGLVQPIWPLWPVRTVVWVLALLCLALFMAFSFRWASVHRVLLGVGANARKGAAVVHEEVAERLALIARLRRFSPPLVRDADQGTRQGPPK